jgi:hypothetical protein
MLLNLRRVHHDEFCKLGPWPLFYCLVQVLVIVAGCPFERVIASVDLNCTEVMEITVSDSGLRPRGVYCRYFVLTISHDPS